MLHRQNKTQSRFIGVSGVGLKSFRFMEFEDRLYQGSEHPK